jgi:hypothetical protein
MAAKLEDIGKYHGNRKNNHHIFTKKRRETPHNEKHPYRDVIPDHREERQIRHGQKQDEIEQNATV